MRIKEDIVVSVNPAEGLKNTFMKMIEGFSEENISKINEEAVRKGYQNAYDEFCKSGGKIESETYLQCRMQVDRRNNLQKQFIKLASNLKLGELNERDRLAKKEGYKSYFAKFCAEHEGEVDLR